MRPALVTTEEALARIVEVDGTQLIEGVPIPPYALQGNRKDTARWVNAQRHAVEMLQLPASSGPVWMLTRTLYNDRENYPD